MACYSLFKLLTRLSGFTETVGCGRLSILVEIENAVLRCRLFDEEGRSEVLALRPSESSIVFAVNNPILAVQ